MKRLIAVTLSVLLVISALPAFAISNVSVSGGSLDRAFEDTRTLYYIKPAGGAVPSVTADGATAVKTATDFDENRVTVLEDDVTGTKYRFVLEKFSAPVITKCEADASGVLTVEGTLPAPCEVLILRPTAADKNTSYALSDIPEADKESVIFEFDTAASASGYTYTFPAAAPSGMYRIVIGGRNTGKENQLEKEFYYASTGDIEAARVALNGLTTGGEVKQFLKENYLMLNLDYDEVTALNDTTALEKMVADKTFAAMPEAIAEINKAIALTQVNDAPAGSVIAVLEANAAVIGITLDADYNAVTGKSAVANQVAAAACGDAAALQALVNKSVAAALVNEAVPSNIETRFLNNLSDLGFTAEQIDRINSLANKDLLLAGLAAGSFADAAAIINAVLPYITSGTTGSQPVGGTVGSGVVAGGGAGGGGGGISSGGGGGGGGAISAYSPDSQTKEPDEEKPSILELYGSVFKDLDSVPWAKESILLLYDWGVINGKGEGIFAPLDNVTREEFVKMVVLAFGISADATPVEYTDVDQNAWYYETVCIATAAKIIQGRDDGTFGVGQHLTREDMAVIIKNAADYAKKTIEWKREMIFTDKAEISDYASAAVKTLADAELINGMEDGSFAPKKLATRAMCARIIYNMIKND